MELFPAAFGQELGYALEKSPAHHWANIVMLTPLANLEWPLHLYKKPHYPVRTHVSTGGAWGYIAKLVFLGFAVETDWSLRCELVIVCSRKKRVPSDCFLSVSKKIHAFSTETNFFPSDLLWRQPQNQVNSLHVDRAATDWEWTPVWRGTGAALFLWVDPVRQQPLVSNGT